MGGIKKQEIIPLVAAILYFIALAYLFAVDVKERKSLTRHMESCYATITGFSTGTKSKSYIDYQFCVEEKVYKGHGRPRKGDTFRIGDSLLVVYDSTNPETNEPKRQYDRIPNILK